ncbi:unnamed protein product [Sympodiomycopsis kandeliae]
MPSDSPSPSPYASASPLNLPSSSTNPQNESLGKDSSMLFIGQPCTDSRCNREDFLPLKCSNCGSSYCSDHFNPDVHKCSYSLHPERKGHGASGNFLVPICPLCDQVPSDWKRQDLNNEEDIERVLILHIENLECTALLENGKKRQRPDERLKNTCSERRCKKNLIVDIRCEKCHLKFCPSHRAPNQHQCGIVQQPVSSSSSSVPSTQQNKSSGSTSLAGLAAMKRLTINQNSTSSPKEQSDPSSPPSSSKLTSGITSRIEGKKVDKRTQSEHMSQLKSLESRKIRGFKLSAKEEERMVELRQELCGVGGMKSKLSSNKDGKKSDGDCVIS